MHPCAPRCSVIPVRAVCSPECRSKAHRFVRTMTPVQRSTDIRSLRERSCEERATSFQTPAVVLLTCSRRKLPATRRLRRDSGCLGRPVVLRSWNVQGPPLGIPCHNGGIVLRVLACRVPGYRRNDHARRAGPLGRHRRGREIVHVRSRAVCRLPAPCLLGTPSFVLARDERRRLSKVTRREHARCDARDSAPERVERARLANFSSRERSPSPGLSSPRSRFDEIACERRL